jgi:hypothetical protein
MIKYIVNVHVNKFNKKGKVTSEEHNYEFSSGNLAKDRKKAIKKAKKLIENSEDLLSKGEKFFSPLEAKLKGYRNFNCYSLTVNLVEDEDEWTTIFGDLEDERFDWLQYEAQVFKENFVIAKFTEIENEEGEFIEVLSDDLDFVLI